MANTFATVICAMIVVGAVYSQFDKDQKRLAGQPQAEPTTQTTYVTHYEPPDYDVNAACDRGGYNAGRPCVDAELRAKGEIAELWAEPTAMPMSAVGTTWPGIRIKCVKQADIWGSYVALAGCLRDERAKLFNAFVHEATER